MTAILSTWFIFCNVNVVTKNMWEVLRRNFDKYLMCTNRILGLTRANITKAPLTRVSLFHKRASLGIFLKMDTIGNLRLGLKLSIGAEDVYSLRRKELYWQYRLETFSPKGLNESAADVELDMFASGTA